LPLRSPRYADPAIHHHFFVGMDNLRNADCGKLSRGNLRKIKCGTFCKLPLIAFPHSAGEKFRIFADRKTTIHSHCITDVQPMHTSVRHPALLSFCILCGPFAKVQGSFFHGFSPFLKIKVSPTFQVSHHNRWSIRLASICTISATVAGMIARIKHV